jgi:hypothetical protein
MLHGVQTWGIYKAWRNIYIVHERFYKRILGVPKRAANCTAEREIRRDSSTGKVKYWRRLQSLDNSDIGEVCLRWQTDSPETDDWVYETKEELSRLRLAYAMNGQLGSANRVQAYGIINVRHNDSERQIMICRIYRMFSLTSYASTKCT